MLSKVAACRSLRRVTSCILMHVGLSSGEAVTQQVHEDWCVERPCQRIVTGRFAVVRELVDSTRVSLGMVRYGTVRAAFPPASIDGRYYGSIPVTVFGRYHRSRHQHHI